MNVIDLTKMQNGKFRLEGQEFNFINLSNMNPESSLKFDKCLVNIIEDIKTEDLCKKVEFMNSTIMCPSILIDTDNEYYWNFIKLIMMNKLICRAITIKTRDINRITKEELQAFMKIKSERVIWKIGNKNRQKCTSPFFGVVQKIATDLYINNILFTHGRIPHTENIYLINCTGDISCQHEVGVRGLTPKLNVGDGTTIYVKDIESLDIYCSDGDKFNLFLMDPKEFKKVRYQGVINNTNCEVMNFHQDKYKFRTFFNVDFSRHDKIQEFFNCKFYNCYFNENQLVMNSMIKACEINGNEENFIDCVVS